MYHLTGDEIKRKTTGFFFTLGATRFFKSRCLGGFTGTHGTFFVTSEIMGPARTGRTYAVRELHKDGSVSTVFQHRFGNSRTAKNCAESLAKGEVTR